MKSPREMRDGQPPVWTGRPRGYAGHILTEWTTEYDEHGIPRHTRTRYLIGRPAPGYIYDKRAHCLRRVAR